MRPVPHILLACSALAIASLSSSAQDTRPNTSVFGVVNAVPTLSIGVQDGAEELMLNRVTGAVRFPDGRIVISNAGTQQLRVFDAKGTFVKNVGTKGGGPGEFGAFSSMKIYPSRDSVIAIDEAAIRFHIFDSQLKFLKTRLFAPVQDYPRPFVVGSFADGSLLTMAFVNGGTMGGEPGTIIKSQYALATYSTAGLIQKRITNVDGQARYVLGFGNIRTFPYIPLVAEPLQAIAGDEIFVMRGPKPELEVFDRTGKRLRTINWAAPTTRVASIWKEYKETNLASMKGEDRARYEKFYSADLPLPELAPTYSAIVVDSERRLWLRRFQIARGPATWDIITAAGAWLGSVQTPARFTLYSVDQKFLLGRQLNDLDVESVQLLQWTRTRK